MAGEVGIRSGRPLEVPCVGGFITAFLDTAPKGGFALVGRAVRIDPEQADFLAVQDNRQEQAQKAGFTGQLHIVSF